MKTVLLLLIVSFGVCAVADAGIFKPGKRHYIFGWRRPDASVDEPPPDNPAPFVDSTLVGLSEQDKKIDAVLDAIFAATMPQPTVDKTDEKVAALEVAIESLENPESQSEGGIPFWLLALAPGGAGAGLGIRRAMKIKQSGGD